METALTQDTVYLVQSHLYLLECCLATYEGLCGLKRQPRGELDRHETILRSCLHALGKKLVVGVRSQPLYFKADWQHLPRVDELVQYMRSGDDIEAAVSRYALKHRHRS